jgi:hypothetical protein
VARKRVLGKAFQEKAFQEEAFQGQRRKIPEGNVLLSSKRFLLKRFS